MSKIDNPKINLDLVVRFLRQYVRHNYGKQCKDFNIGCSSCLRYLALDIFVDDLSLEGWANVNEEEGNEKSL